MTIGRCASIPASGGGTQVMRTAQAITTIAMSGCRKGGSAPDAVRGVAELVEELPFIPDTMMVACGTGATLAGLLAGLQGRGRVIGVAVLKNAEYLHREIALLLRQAGYPAYDNYTLLTDCHHGGYGKAPLQLRQFCADFVQETGIPIEPVYTGKLFHALRQMAQAGVFRQDERIVAVHTGGLQGARGFEALQNH